MAYEDFDETSSDDYPEGRKRRSGRPATAAVFGLGVVLLIALLYLAY